MVIKSNVDHNFGIITICWDFIYQHPWSLINRKCRHALHCILSRQHAFPNSDRSLIWTMNRKPRVLRRNSWTEACREFMFIENPWTVRPNPRMVCRKFFQRIHEPNSWLVPCQENHEPPGRTHVVLVRKNMSRQAELMLGILVQWRQLFWAVKGAWMLIFPPAQKTIDEGRLDWRICYGAGGLAVGGTPSGDGIWFGTSWEDDINYVYCV